MTTIAYREGVLAADSQVNSGNGARSGIFRKIGMTHDGWLWGFSGSLHRQADCVAWAEASRDGKPPEWDGDDGVFILVSPAGAVKEWWGKGWIAWEVQPYHAWGSGERIALGAMHAGATAQAAVEASIAIDTESGGAVLALSLGAAR